MRDAEAGFQLPVRRSGPSSYFSPLTTPCALIVLISCVCPGVVPGDSNVENYHPSGILPKGRSGHRKRRNASSRRRLPLDGTRVGGPSSVTNCPRGGRGTICEGR